MEIGLTLAATPHLKSALVVSEAWGGMTSTALSAVPATLPASLSRDHFKLNALRDLRGGWTHVYTVMDYARAAHWLVDQQSGEGLSRELYKVLAYGAVAAEVVGHYYRITPAEMFADSRLAEPFAGARFIALAITLTLGGFQKTQVAKVFSRDRTSVGHAAQTIEELRMQDEAFERHLDMLESAVLDYWALCDAGRNDDLLTRIQHYL